MGDLSSLLLFSLFFFSISNKVFLLIKKEVMGVKGGPLGVMDAMQAETMGLLEKLKLARDK